MQRRNRGKREDAIADAIEKVLFDLDELLAKEAFSSTDKFENYLVKSTRRRYTRSVKKAAREQGVDDIDSYQTSQNWHDADESCFAHIMFKRLLETGSHHSEDLQAIFKVIDPDRTAPLNATERKQASRARDRLSGCNPSEFAGRKHVVSSPLTPSSEERTGTMTCSNIRTRKPPI